jgi:two-component system, OmpR family, response regulator VanR
VRVLVVEDEAILAEALQAGLRRQAIAVDVALDAEGALELLDVNAYDVVVLDRDLPGMHGDQLCQLIVADHPSCRVLMLTAARQLGDRVGGLQLGADDYLTKPFEFPELAARLRALHRRSPIARPPQLDVAGIQLDPFSREVRRGSKVVDLTRKEFAVLEILMSADGGLVSAEDLLEKAWDVNADPFTNAVRITISTLRAKLGQPSVIETVAGVGYRLMTSATSKEPR